MILPHQADPVCNSTAGPWQLVMLTFVIVVLRYGFNLGWIWLQESVTYLHAMLLLQALVTVHSSIETLRRTSV